MPTTIIRHIKIGAISLGLLVLLVIPTLARADSAPGLITAVEARKALGGEHAPRLFDVRTEAEFIAVRFEGAINIPLDEFESGAYRKKFKDIGKDDAIIVSCRSGRRSGIVQKILIGAGYSNIKNLDGGIIAWERAGLPVVRGSVEQESKTDERAREDTSS